jgi:hypothetical protein
MSAGPTPMKDYEYWNRAQRAIYMDDTKFIWDSHGEIKQYRIDPDDPCDQEFIGIADKIPENNIFKQDIVVSKECAERISSTIDISEETEDRLSDLGYL